MQAETTKTLRKIGQTAERLIAEKIPHYERMPLLRNEAQLEGIYFNDKELLGVVASARQRLKGKSDGLGTGQEIYIPEESWAWDGVIAARTLNLLVALPKVGKSALIAGFISAWKYGSGEFLGHKINGSCPPVIIVGPDQSLGDWSKILFPAGLMRKKKEDYFELVDPIVKLWSRGDNLALDDEGIERIVNEADKHENPFVFADAFAKLISPLGLDERLPEAVEPVHNLVESLEHTNATLVLLHHASKTRSSERASNASRGGNALPAAASQCIQLNLLNEQDKSDQKIKLSTEGRNSKPIEQVIEQIDRSQWVSHGSVADLEKEKQLEKIEAGLLDKQSMALGFLRDSWEREEKLEATRLAVLMADEFGNNARVKAKTTLDQLVKKGLAQKENVSDSKRGKVSFFWPYI